MAIKSPKWAARAGAYPTAKGWTVNRGKGKTEVIQAAKFNAEEIAEWHGASAPAPEVVVAPVVQTLHEAPSAHEERPLFESEVEHHYDDSFGGNDEERLSAVHPSND
jgi:hypothetical protein